MGLVLALAGILASFWAGRGYQSATTAWTDHRDQRAKERRLRRARWSAWRGLFWPLCGVLAVVAFAYIAGR